MDLPTIVSGLGPLTSGPYYFHRGSGGGSVFSGPPKIQPRLPKWFIALDGRCPIKLRGGTAERRYVALLNRIHTLQTSIRFEEQQQMTSRSTSAGETALKEAIAEYIIIIDKVDKATGFVCEWYGCLVDHKRDISEEIWSYHIASREWENCRELVFNLIDGNSGKPVKYAKIDRFSSGRPMHSHRRTQSL
ncbi:hypothetical protein BX600DRAFT_505117 [Xylariales sp. PMI_506]|nr:hypothetical protein BX600DRAFT_505117 [Xylariales sp. PMI_506]